MATAQHQVTKDDYPLLVNSSARLTEALHHPQSSAETVARIAKTDPGFCWKLFSRAYGRAKEQVDNVHDLSHLISLIGLPYAEQLLQGSKQLKKGKPETQSLELFYFTSQLAAEFLLNTSLTLHSETHSGPQQKHYYPCLFFLQPAWGLYQKSSANSVQASLYALANNERSLGRVLRSLTLNYSSGPFQDILGLAWEALLSPSSGTRQKRQLIRLSHLPEYETLGWLERNPKARALWHSPTGTILLCNSIAWTALWYGPNSRQLRRLIEIAARCWQQKPHKLLSLLSKTLVTLNHRLSNQFHWQPAATWLALSGYRSILTGNQGATLTEKHPWLSHKERLENTAFPNLNELFNCICQGVSAAGFSRSAILLIDRKQQVLRTVSWQGTNPADRLRSLSLDTRDEVNPSLLKPLLSKNSLFLLRQENRKQAIPKLPLRLAEQLPSEALLCRLQKNQRAQALLVAIPEDTIDKQAHQGFTEMVLAGNQALEKLSRR